MVISGKTNVVHPFSPLLEGNKGHLILIQTKQKVFIYMDHLGPGRGAYD